MAVDALGRVVVGGARFAENGERIARGAELIAQNAERVAPAVNRCLEAVALNPGHVVVGNGLLDPTAREIVQRITVEFGSNPPWVPFERAVLIPTQVPHASTLVRRASNPSLMEHNQNERDREMDRFRERNERDWDRLQRAGRELALTAGCAGAGDTQGAFEHGIQAGIALTEPYVEAGQGLWQATKNFFGWGD